MAQAYYEFEDIKVTVVISNGNRKVVACDTFSKGQLMLVALSPTVVVSNKQPSHAVDVPITVPGMPTYSVYIVCKWDLPDEKTTVDESILCPPFWCVATTPGSARAIVTLGHYDVKGSIGEGRNENPFSIAIPVYKNFRKIGKGDEILFHTTATAAAAEKRMPRPSAPAESSRSSKKHKS